MCYHASVSPQKVELEKRFEPEVVDLPDWEPIHHVSGFAFPHWPVVQQESGQRVMRAMQWGLIPSWVKDEQSAAQIRTKTLNAKAETVAEKPSFRKAVRNNRCLVPFTGFFEWQTVGSKKFPHYIHLRDEQIGSFAGIFESWTNRATGEILETYSVLTTEANPLMARIHNTKKRMPVILERQHENLWIDPELPLEEVLQLAKPLDESLLEAWPISKRITSRTEDSNVPEVIQRVNYPELNTQTNLF